jgi:large subunit ribosomal protein L22
MGCKEKDDAMQVQAITRYAKVTPRKARQVADLIRRKNVEQALDILAFTKKNASLMLSKILKSAVANANQKKRVDVEKLVIHSIQVDPGPMQRNAKRFIPRAMGRASAIHHRTSHIKIVITDGSAS